jgi:anthranilate synthase component 2
VQFHPESIASDHGHLMLRNFLDIAALWNVANGRRAAAPAAPHQPHAYAQARA